ncbi:MAG: cupin domain-containing protein [Gemmatimonadota bacterium]|nr:cupin domain-containing protein [Gemmatimonadota bacterium]MDE3007255.1 cupin domain-containing protein [Gemmatimonadota bacterium]MDE3015021.1 cupin domain-containing protein [Gemmatimonadota bacterium]
MADRYHLASIEPRELIPGHHGRFVHSEHTTHVYWDIDQGAQLPEHSHPHEQVVNLLEGTYELIVDGESHVLEAGNVLVIPGGATHSGEARTACRILDVFSPVREEYR